jgi:hypothetical protein
VDNDAASKISTLIASITNIFIKLALVDKLIRKIILDSGPRLCSHVQNNSYRHILFVDTPLQFQNTDRRIKFTLFWVLPFVYLTVSSVLCTTCENSRSKLISPAGFASCADL